METDVREYLVKQLEQKKNLLFSSEEKLEFNNLENNELQKIIFNSRSEIKRLENALAGYGNTSVVLIETEKRQRAKKINWSALSINVLQKENKLMTSSGILEKIFPALSEDLKNELAPKLSSTLYKLTKKKQIRNYDLGIRGYFFGLPNWFEESDLPFQINTQPKEKYKI